MAPVEPEVTSRSNTAPLALFSTQVLLVAGLSAHIVQTIRRAAKTLSPPVSTRAQEPVRRRHVAVFSALAAVSLASVATFAVAWRVISYLEWAERGDHQTPGSVWTGWYGTGDEGVGRWRLGDWLRDVDLLRESDRVAVQTTEGFLWTSQHFVALLVLSIFVGVEGHRRNLPAKTITAFIALAGVGSIGYALNLFFITILYTPLALYTSTPPRRDALFAPKPPIYWIPVLGSLFSVWSLPALLENNSNVGFFRFGYFAVPLFLAFASQIIPTSWGHQHVSKAHAHRSYTATFWIVGVASTIFYYTQISGVVSRNTPEQHSHIYDLFKNAVGKRENHNRFLIGLGNAAHNLRHFSTHPVISVTSSDILITTLSLLAWAFLRNLDVNDILDTSLLSYFSTSHKEAEKHVAFQEKVDVEPEPELEPAPAPAPTTTPAKKGRGRPRKNGSVASLPSAAALRRSTRGKPKSVSDFGSDAEDLFEPAPEAKREAKNIEVDAVPTEENLVEGGESAALSMVLFLLGGVGQLAASVLGAEVSAEHAGAA